MENIEFVDLDIKCDQNNTDRGMLIPFESLKNVPFEMKRFFIIRGIRDNVARGNHSHYRCKQMFVLLNGSLNVQFDDVETVKSFKMDDITKAIIVPENIWCVMNDISEDCVLLVISSDYYDESEYCRSYEDFKVHWNKLRSNKPNVPVMDLKKNTQSIRNDLTIKFNEMLDRGDYVLGKELREFEANFSKYVGSEHCVTMSNGTATLNYALQILDLGNDAEIITQANTYIAAPLAISRAGYNIKLVDCDPDTLMMDLDKLEQSITEKTKAIIVVHLYGSSPNMERLMEIAKSHNLYVIEDAAQAHGSTYNGKMLGTFGDMGSFSFYPSKNLGAFGEGGCVVTDNEEFKNKLELVRNYGCKERYKWVVKGTNERMDTMQAAFLNVKLNHLQEWNDKRRYLANIYNNNLQNISGLVPLTINENVSSCYHLYIVKATNREKLMAHLKSNNIHTGIHYPYAFYKSEAYSELNELTFDVTEKIVDEILSLPMFPEMTEDQVMYVCDTIKQFY